MKKIILNIISLFICVSTFSQKRTVVTGFVGDCRDSSIAVSFGIYDPYDLKKNRPTNYDTTTKNGFFKIEFDIIYPVNAYAFLNNKHIFFPGVTSILIEPGDSLHILVPRIEEIGIKNVKVTGRGASKIDLLTEMMTSVLAYYKTERAYNIQTLHEKFINTDRRIKVADSVFYNFRDKIPYKIKGLIRAQVAESNLDMLFLSSISSENDSLSYYFDRYIVKRNRLEPLLKEDNIYFFGGRRVVPNYSLLKAFRNPFSKGLNFRNNSKMEYARVLIKHFKEYPIVRDYLLARLTKRAIKEIEVNMNSDDLFHLYSKTVDSNSFHYNDIQSIHKYFNETLKANTEFYKFVLPDSTGKLHHLDDFKGKIVLLDFWFNGCVACKKIAPMLDEIERELENDKIQFISIGIDKLKSWKAGIGIYSSKKALQLYTEDQGTDHPVIKYLNLSAYPRLILIDKNGNLIGTPPSPVTHKEEFMEFLDKYL